MDRDPLIALHAPDAKAPGGGHDHVVFAATAGLVARWFL